MSPVIWTSEHTLWTDVLVHRAEAQRNACAGMCAREGRPTGEEAREHEQALVIVSRGHRQRRARSESDLDVEEGTVRGARRKVRCEVRMRTERMEWLG